MIRGNNDCRVGGKACPTRARNNSACRISADGAKGWSYGTMIFQLLPSGTLLVNVTRYSATTSHHQKHLRAWHLPAHDMILHLDDVPRGTSSLEDLINRRAMGIRSAA